jgi:hypothetical protein
MTLFQSPEIGKLAEALAKAQAAIKGAHKDSTNPHFKSNYADLESVWDACRVPLSGNGLAVVQTLHTEEKGLYLRTTLIHSSGEYMAGNTPILTSQNTMQGLGSAITYARRYGLSAMVGVAPSDDDGEAAMGRGESKPPSQPKQDPQASPSKGKGDLSGTIRGKIGYLTDTFKDTTRLAEIYKALGVTDPKQIPLADPAKQKEWLDYLNGLKK